MLHAIESLKNNRSRLGNRNFWGQKNYSSIRKEYRNAQKKILFEKQENQKYIAALREEVKQQRSKENYLKIIIVAVLLLLCSIIF